MAQCSEGKKNKTQYKNETKIKRNALQGMSTTSAAWSAHTCADPAPAPASVRLQSQHITAQLRWSLKPLYTVCPSTAAPCPEVISQLSPGQPVLLPSAGQSAPLHRHLLRSVTRHAQCTRTILKISRLSWRPGSNTWNRPTVYRNQ